MEMQQDTIRPAFKIWMAITDDVMSLNLKPCALVTFNTISQIENIKRLHQGSGNQQMVRTEVCVLGPKQMLFLGLLPHFETHL